MPTLLRASATSCSGSWTRRRLAAWNCSQIASFRAIERQGKNMMCDVVGEEELENDAEAVDAERTGRTNTAREMTANAEEEPPTGRWDSIGEPGEGLDELQGLYAHDASTRDHL